MNKENSHIVAGAVLVFLALCAIGGAWVALTDNAHANGDKPSPTQRDWQRLNICANYSVRPEIKPELQEKEAIECAAKGKAVARIESANGKSRAARELLNAYGYMRCSKGKCHGLMKFKSTAAADRAWAQAYFDHYSKQSLKSLAYNWTRESHMVKSYTASLNKYVPEYRKLYRAMASN